MSKAQSYIKRELIIPDHLRIARYERSPELGPRILFFSGGSALNEFSKRLKKFTHNSVHFMTPFDSGGSSAVLRQAFNMPAIGDLRARLMALADDSVKGLPSVFNLFSHRLDKHAPHPVLEQQFTNMVTGEHPLVQAVSEPMRQLICNQLRYFQQHKPESFNLRGASIGNLILAGGYLNHQGQLDPIVFLFSKLVEVRGDVRLTVNDNYHLQVTLKNGDKIVGQHKMTGKEYPPINTPISCINLVDSLDAKVPVESDLSVKHSSIIDSADIICFPPGSFFSSIVASLLPRGVGRAIVNNKVPKIYMPSTGEDPEMLGMSLDDAIRKLVHYVQKDLCAPVAANEIISHVLLDKEVKPKGWEHAREKWREQGIQFIETTLTREESSPLYHPDLLLGALLSFG